MENQIVTISVNVDIDTLEEATNILKEIGLDINTAINRHLAKLN